MMATYQHDSKAHLPIEAVEEVGIEAAYMLGGDGDVAGSCGEENQAMRKALCQLLYCWIDCIQLTLSDQLRHQNRPAQGSPSNEVDIVDESEYEMIFPESQWQIFNGSELAFSVVFYFSVNSPFCRLQRWGRSHCID